MEQNIENRKRYYNIIRKMNLQDEALINDALRKKGLYSTSDGTFPLSMLHFELTSHCNAYCKHCYNNSGENHIKDIMTPDRWIEFAKYIVNKGGVFECLLSGGEPLLIGRKVFDIMDILDNDGTIFLFMTNAYLMTRDLAKRFSKYKYHWFQISIDGSKAEYHDNFRQLNGSWAKAIEGAKYVVDEGIPLKIAHCVTPENLNDVDEMCALAYSLGATSIMMGGVSLSGRTGNNRYILLSEEQKQILDAKIENNRIKYEGKLKVKKSNSVKQGLKRHSQRPNTGAIIRPNGDIRIDGMAPFTIGNVLEDDFSTVWKNRINSCWNDTKVRKFIDEFDTTDRNEQYINYLNNDIKL